MIEDMTIRKFAPRTQEGYIRAVKTFSAFLEASPDTASAKKLRRYRLHLVASGTGDQEPQPLSHPCPFRGERMIVIETFERRRGCSAKGPIVCQITHCTNCSVCASISESRYRIAQ
jgi:hypothetical protein